MRIATLVFALSLLLGLTTVLHFGCTEMRWIPQVSAEPTWQTGGPPSIVVSHQERGDKDLIAIYMQYINWVDAKDQDVTLTVHCGTERLLGGGDETLPVVAGLQPAAYFPDACVGEVKVLTQPGAVWLLFPRPKAMGSSFVLSLPRITCSGRQCVNLVIPATVDFVRERVKKSLVLHG